MCRLRNRHLAWAVLVAFALATTVLLAAPGPTLGDEVAKWATAIGLVGGVTAWAFATRAVARKVHADELREHNADPAAHLAAFSHHLGPITATLSRIETLATEGRDTSRALHEVHTTLLERGLCPVVEALDLAKTDLARAKELAKIEAMLSRGARRSDGPPTVTDDAIDRLRGRQ